MAQHEMPLPPVWVRCTSAVVRRLPLGRYRLMNWLCRRQGTPVFWGKMDAGDGGHQFRCDLQDIIAREVCFTGRYEPQETALIRALLKPAGVFVDVGANWGYYTLLAAHRIGGGGRVISLEPDPRIFSSLEQNVARNGLPQVTALQVAAADRTSTMSLAGFDEQGGNFGISRLVEERNTTGRSFQVPTRPLDELLDEIGVQRIDLLKMDIEGAEGLALMGLSRSLSDRRVDRLLLELHPAQLSHHGHSASGIIDKLIQLVIQRGGSITRPRRRATRHMLRRCQPVRC